MKLIGNSGNDRVVDALRKALPGAGRLDIASPEFSLFAFAELRSELEGSSKCRVVLPTAETGEIRLLGGENDRPFRNQLHARALSRECARWISEKVEVRGLPGPLPQSALIASGGTLGEPLAITGNCAFSTNGLGVTPGNQFGLIQCSESGAEGSMLAGWFSALWNSLAPSSATGDALYPEQQQH